MHLTLAFISALLATAKAIQVTQPAAGDTVDVSHDWEVTWTSVSTDSAQICLYLSNFVDYPPQTIFLQGPLDTTLGSTVVGGQCYTGLPISSHYRIRATKCYDPNTIYAESGEFSATQPSCSS